MKVVLKPPWGCEMDKFSCNRIIGMGRNRENTLQTSFKYILGYLIKNKFSSQPNRIPYNSHSNSFHYKIKACINGLKKCILYQTKLSNANKCSFLSSCLIKIWDGTCVKAANATKTPLQKWLLFLGSFISFIFLLLVLSIGGFTWNVLKIYHSNCHQNNVCTIKIYKLKFVARFIVIKQTNCLVEIKTSLWGKLHTNVLKNFWTGFKLRPSSMYVLRVLLLKSKSPLSTAEIVSLKIMLYILKAKHHSVINSIAHLTPRIQIEKYWRKSTTLKPCYDPSPWKTA